MTSTTLLQDHGATATYAKTAAPDRSSPGILVGQLSLSHLAIFPNEMFDIIISHTTDIKTLLSLGQCCRAFALSVNPWLYSSLKFTASPKSIKLARTLTRCPPKAQLVTSIVADLLDIELILLPAGLKFILAAIVCCPNLASLSVVWRFQWATGRILTNAFKLYHFTTFQWNQTVSQFLEMQPCIQDLRIVGPGPNHARGGGHEPSLNPSALPRLSSFEGRLPQALTVVSGRPVSSISLYGAVTLPNLERALPELAKSTVQIESLSLQVDDLSPELFTLVSAYLPRLSRFELRIVRSSTVAYSNLTSKSLCEAMSLLARLEYFRIRLRCPQLFWEHFYHKQRDVILDWACQCPSLKKVVFESSSENKAPEWTFDEEAMDWMCSYDE
ncbi:hypothetical protein RhiJN_04613 [Ceratobasidium sp. AG-Ba]|nr:hypothetical protein RhiJN_04613 [Ceratobasidium sp. AG-Ba]